MLKMASSSIFRDVLLQSSRPQHRWHARCTGHTALGWQAASREVLSHSRSKLNPSLCSGWSKAAYAAASSSQEAAGDHSGCGMQLPTEAHGKVMASEANYLRVDVLRLEGSAEPPPRRQLLCRARSLLRKMRQTVLVGDAVRLVGIDWQQGRGLVDAVGPRASELVDPAIANVDHVVLLFGLTQPPFDPQQVTRFLVSIEAADLPITLVLNKEDLVPEAEARARLQQCRAWGYSAYAVSCETGRGVEQVLQRLQGSTAVVAGPSGAGKSSLINALRYGRHRQDAWSGYDDHEQDDMVAPWQDEGNATLGSAASSSSSSSSSRVTDALLQDLPLPVAAAAQATSAAAADSPASSSNKQQPQQFLTVGEMSKIGRGKHTTRTVSLIALPGGGLLADTPGFNMPALEQVSSADLAHLFPEFRSRMEAQPCRFDNCQHVMEPGCSISSEDFERYEYYLKLLGEVKAREECDIRALQLGKRRREGATKIKAEAGGGVRHEVRLEAKKHRQVSRRKAKQGLLSDLQEQEEAW